MSMDCVSLYLKGFNVPAAAFHQIRNFIKIIEKKNLSYQTTFL